MIPLYFRDLHGDGHITQRFSQLASYTIDTHCRVGEGRHGSYLPALVNDQLWSDSVDLTSCVEESQALLASYLYFNNILRSAPSVENLWIKEGCPVGHPARGLPYWVAPPALDVVFCGERLPVAPPLSFFALAAAFTAASSSRSLYSQSRA